MLAMVDKYLFSEWLNNELKARDWSQADLARAAGLTRSTINGVVTGTRGAGTEFCNAIAHAFKIPPEEVFRIAGLLPPKEDDDEKLREEMNYKISQLPPDLQEDAMRYVDFLLEKQEQKNRGKNNLDLKKPLGATHQG